MPPQKFSKDHLVLIFIRLKLNEKKFRASTAGDFFIMKDFFDTSESSKEKVKLDGQSMNADSDGNAERNIRNDERPPPKIPLTDHTERSLAEY